MIFFRYSLILLLVFSFFCHKTILINPEYNPEKTHSDSVLKVKFSPDGRYIASGGKDSDLFLWDGKSGKLLKQIKGNYDSIFDIEFLPSGNEVITANYNGNILIWNLNSGKFQNIMVDKNFISSLALVLDKQSYITSSWESGVKIISSKDNSLIRECKNGNFKIQSIEYSKSTDSIYAGSADGYLIRWPYETCDKGKDFEFLAASDSITSIDINETKQILVFGSSDRFVKIYNLETLKEIKKFSGHKSQINSVKILPKQNKIASVDKDGKIFIWDIKTGDPLQIEAHVDSINSIDMSPDGKFIVTGGSDNAVKLWKLSKVTSKKKRK